MESETCDMCGKTITNNHPTAFCDTTCEKKFVDTRAINPEYRTAYSPTHVVRTLREVYDIPTAEAWRWYRTALDRLIEGVPTRMMDLEKVVANHDARRLLKMRGD